MNVICLVGNLVKDPEIRFTSSQKQYAYFTLAVERGYKTESGERPADFINCVTWDQSAAFLEKYARKGAKISVVGSLRSSKWQTDGGETRYKMEVNCTAVEIASFSKRERGDYGDETPRQERAEAGEEAQKPKRTRAARKHGTTPGSGYEVYTPPGFEELDNSGELPF